jgi:beta-glucosidase
LSYARFEYSDLRVEPASARPGERVEVSVDVKNTGLRAGHEVVQLYARPLTPTPSAPVRQLCGFERVPLAAGEQRRVTFQLAPAEALARYDADRTRFTVEPGEYVVEAGASSRDIRLTTALRIPPQGETRGQVNR